MITEPGVVYDMSDEDVFHIRVGRSHVALVDRADVDLVNANRWHLLRGHNGKLYAYARRVYMHRLIAATPPGYETDHINGDGLDNRRANLRPATASENRANMSKPRRPDGSTPSSIYKGVSWDRARRRWQSKIQVNGRHKNLGRYATEVEAAVAYDIAAAATWGEFAALNFPAVTT